VALAAVEVAAALAGVVGVGGLVAGSAYMVRDTRLAVANLTEEAAHLRDRLRIRPPPAQG